MAVTTAEAGAISRARGFRLSESQFAYLLNSPVILMTLGVYAYPIAYSLWLSLHRWQLTRPQDRRFLGLQQYLQVLSTEEFRSSLQVSVVFALVALALVLSVGTVTALVLNEPFKGRGLARALILIPWAIPPVVNGFMWKWIFDGTIGVFNGVLYSLGLIDSYYPWLMDTRFTVPLVAFANSASDTAFASIILLAALQAIPPELYEAARVDRAGVLARFRRITLPWLLQPYLVVIIVATVNALRAFDVIYTMTGGGPVTASTTLAWRTYSTAFRFLDFGKGATYGYFLAMMTSILAVLYIRLLFRRGEIKV